MCKRKKPPVLSDIRSRAGAIVAESRDSEGYERSDVNEFLEYFAPEPAQGPAGAREDPNDEVNIEHVSTGHWGTTPASPLPLGQHCALSTRPTSLGPSPPATSSAHSGSSCSRSSTSPWGQCCLAY